MRDRLWIVIPAAGFPFLLVLFIVLWQSLQQQSHTIQDLVKQLDRLNSVELRDRTGSRELIEQQLGVLQTRQQSLQRKISNLERWQRASADRERALWNRIETPFPSNRDLEPREDRDLERTAPPGLPSSQQQSSQQQSSQQPVISP